MLKNTCKIYPKSIVNNCKNLKRFKSLYERFKMIKKELFLFLFCLILAVSLVSAADMISGQGEELNIVRTCFNNGTFCSSSAECNLTITNPNSHIIINNDRMTNNVSFHNFTLNKDQTVVLGIYRAIMTCTDGTVHGGDTFTIQITPTGDPGNLIGFFIILFVIGYGMVIFAFVNENKQIAILGGMALITIGVYTGINGIDIYENSATEMISIFTWAFGAIVSTVAGIEWLKETFG